MRLHYKLGKHYLDGAVFLLQDKLIVKLMQVFTKTENIV